MDKLKIQQAVAAFRYQTAPGIHTWSACDKSLPGEETTHGARGGRTCVRCLRDDLDVPGLLPLLEAEAQAGYALDQLLWDADDSTDLMLPKYRKAATAARAAVNEFINHL